MTIFALSLKPCPEYVCVRRGCLYMCCSDVLLPLRKCLSSSVLEYNLGANKTWQQHRKYHKTKYSSHRFQWIPIVFYLWGILGEDSIKSKHLWSSKWCTPVPWAGLGQEWRLIQGQLLLPLVHLQERHGLRRVLHPNRWTDPHHHFHLLRETEKDGVDKWKYYVRMLMQKKITEKNVYVLWLWLDCEFVTIKLYRFADTVAEWYDGKKKACFFKEAVKKSSNPFYSVTPKHTEPGRTQQLQNCSNQSSQHISEKLTLQTSLSGQANTSTVQKIPPGAPTAF